MKAESRYSGYLVLVTDQMELSAKEALDIYRSKDAVETAFYDLKNEQDARRLGTHGVAVMEWKLFNLLIPSIPIFEIRRWIERGMDAQQGGPYSTGQDNILEGEGRAPEESEESQSCSLCTQALLSCETFGLL